MEGTEKKPVVLGAGQDEMVVVGRLIVKGEGRRSITLLGQDRGRVRCAAENKEGRSEVVRGPGVRIMVVSGPGVRSVVVRGLGATLL